MMNRIPLLALLLFCIITAFGRQLTPTQALQRLQTADVPFAKPSKIADNPLPALTIGDDSGNKCVYLFDSEDGFLILAADDCAAPLLGFGDGPMPNISDMPPAMKEWLQLYAAEIGVAIAKGSPAYAPEEPARAQLKTIQPLLTSKWNQDSPYNNMCPVYSGSTRCYTGCVATAAAQIMYKHKYPAKGTGKYTHTDDINGKQYTCTVDFGATTYSWNSMTPTYNNKSTQAAKNAVAVLMRDLGVALHMDYAYLGINQSGANLLTTAGGMIDYFNYSKGIRYLSRECYTPDQWRSMVHNELLSGQPLLYEGMTTGAGHAFVCDGYDSASDRFHFNWGWGGNGDGYYALSALNPNVNAGIGGGDYNYTGNQAALFGISKPVAGETYYPNVRISGDLTSNIPITDFPGHTFLTVSNTEYEGFYNYTSSSKAVHMLLGLELDDKKGNTTVIPQLYVDALEPLYGYGSLSVSLSDENIASGDYTARPVVCMSDESRAQLSEWQYVNIPTSKAQSVDIHIGKYYMTCCNELTDRPVLRAGGLNAPEEIQYCEPFTVKAEIKAEYADFNGTVLAKAVNGNNNVVLGKTTELFIPKGQTLTVEIPCELNSHLSNEAADLCLSANGNIFYDESSFTVNTANAKLSFTPGEWPESVLPDESFSLGGVLSAKNYAYSGYVECRLENVEGQICAGPSKQYCSGINGTTDKTIAFSFSGLPDEGEYTVIISVADKSVVVDKPIIVAKRKFTVESVDYKSTVNNDNEYYLNFAANIALLSGKTFNGYVNYTLRSEDGQTDYCSWTNYESLRLDPGETVAVDFRIDIYKYNPGLYYINLFMPLSLFDTEGESLGEAYPLTITDSSALAGPEAKTVPQITRTADGSHMLSGAATGDMIRIHSADGSLRYQCVAMGTDVFLPSAQWPHGVYIVTFGKHKIKFII